MPEVKFGNTVIEIDDVVVAKITSYNASSEISEEDITGSEDVVPGTNVLSQQFTPIAIAKTCEVEGIVIESGVTGRDYGQSALKTAADSGKVVTVKETRNTGFGAASVGFFTAYEENASTSEVYKFKGTFRVNSVTTIQPGS
jgi:hypothetical protein